MTIAIDIRSLQSHPGGITEYVLALCTSLLKTTDEHYYIFFTSGTRQLSIPFPHSGPRHEVVHCRLPNKILNATLFLFRWPKLDHFIETRVGRKIDVFFMPNIGFCSFTHRANIVLTVHDISFALYPQLFGWKMRAWHILICPRNILMRAQRIIAVSHWTRHNLIREYAISEDRITVTPLASSLHQTNGKTAALPPSLRDERRYLLLLGAHDNRKNAQGIIDAFVRARSKYPSTMHGMSLVLTGDVGTIERVICSVSGTAAVREYIICVGFVDRKERDRLIASAWGLLYPSMYEGFGIPLLEAAQYGIPIVASARASIGEVIDCGALLIDPYNSEELAFAMHSICSDRELRSAVTQGYKAQEGTFNWNKTARHTREALEYAHRN